mgnify:CR=1 FL=1
MCVSQKVKKIAPSLTLEITAKAKKMKAEGFSVIGFGAGEPDFNTPQYIIDSAKKALDIGFTKYTPAAGTVELKNAICQKFLFDNKLNYEPAQIVISTGRCTLISIYTLIIQRCYLSLVLNLTNL